MIEYPSPGMLFSCDQASAPPAPALFTTIRSWLNLALNTCCCRRAATSDSPPGANGMMYCTGLSG